MKKKILFFLLLLTVIVVPKTTYAVPAKPPGEGGAPGSSTSVTHSGANTISSDTEEDGKEYSSTASAENALLVTGGTSTIKNITLNKSGNDNGDSSDFYGTNAGILVKDGILNINGGSITTNAQHANAVFAYLSGVINISNVNITTTGDNSGGVMVTGGGALTANSCTVKTSGNSSASIRSDRGGGTLTVNKGSYETTGTGSPAIYSTANITVNDAELTSKASEGVVIEGNNSVTLNNTTVTDTNNTLNGNSETYKNIFIYQSMSGDADEGEARFTAKNSKLITNKGDTIFVTNTKTIIELENNEITNNDGDFLRVQSGKWGNSGSNGGDVTLNLTNQKVNGDTILDNISTLNMSLKEKSIYVGSINNSNTAKNVSLTLSKDSVISLTSDMYVSSLTNEDSTNSNIYSNGKYKLYVNGEEASINKGTYTDGSNKKTTVKSSTNKVSKNTNYNKYYIGLGVIVLLLIIIIVIVKKK